MNDAIVDSEASEIMETAHAIITASFDGDASTIRHLALDEENPTLLIMALGQLCAKSLDSLATERGHPSGLMMWSRGLQRRAADS